MIAMKLLIYTAFAVSLAKAQSGDKIPSCGHLCLNDAAAIKNCKPDEFQCICKEFDIIQAAAAGCILNSCGATSAVGKHYTHTFCNSTIANPSLDQFLPSIAELCKDVGVGSTGGMLGNSNPVFEAVERPAHTVPPVPHPDTSKNIVKTTSSVPMTTSTVYTTKIRTITECPSSVPNCPTKSTTVVTETIPAYTTVCPIKSGGAGSGDTGNLQLATSTVYTTKVRTVTKCHSSVLSCPAKSTVLVTETIAVSTTVCPVDPNSITPTITATAKAAVVSAGAAKFALMDSLAMLGFAMLAL